MSEGRFVVRSVTGWGISQPASRQPWTDRPALASYMVLDRVYSHRAVAEFNALGRDGSGPGDAVRRRNAEALAAELNARYPLPAYLKTEGRAGSRSRRRVRA